MSTPQQLVQLRQPLRRADVEPRTRMQFAAHPPLARGGAQQRGELEDAIAAALEQLRSIDADARIDELIYQHPKVKEGITIGLPDPRKGERIKVYIVLKEGEMARPEDVFITYFKERLTPYKVPSEIEFREDLPKSMIGKILRRALREEEGQKAEKT